MIKKKVFSILQLEAEAEYLNAQAAEGMIFKRSLGDGHEFEVGEPVISDYRVEYTIDPLESSQMFDCVDAYHSSKGGYYTYLIRREAGDFVSNQDRIDTITMQKNRIDRFTGIVLGGLVILFTYMYLTQNNPLYLIIIALGLIMSGYVLYHRNKMTKLINFIK